MNIHIAAPYAEQKAARALREVLAADGFTIVSTWLDSGVPESTDEAVRLAGLEKNVYDLRHCDGIIVLAHVGTPGETFVEVGRYLERRRINGLPVYAVWTHAVNGKGRRLSDSTPGVRRVTLSSVSCAADWTIVLAEASAMREAWLSDSQRRSDGMAVYDVEDEDNS